MKLMTGLQHLLVFFLVVVTPLWDWYEIPRLKASTAPRKKIRFYQKIMAASWICAVVAVATVGLASTFHVTAMPTEIGWLASGARGRVIVLGAMVGMALAIFVPAVLALWSDAIRGKAGRAAKKLAFLLPSTREERSWWWIVSITAGICEEFLYRGFLMEYLHLMPWHLSLTWALVVSSAIFGIGHLYQGIAGAVQTAVAGFIFGCLFVMTGSLLLPIVVHAVMDLRALALLPEGFETA